jgi:DNA transposition AAA+ family ATPase
MAEQKPIDNLIQDARVLGPTRAIRDVDPAKVTREQAGQVAAAVKAFRDRTRVSNVYIGRAAGIFADDVSDFILGRLRGNWQQAAIDLDRWLEDEHKRDAAPRPTAFVWTKVAEEVRTVAEAAVALRTIGVVYGPSGIGKTLALRAVAADKPGSVLISIETAAATGAGIIDALAKALRANTGPRYLSARHVLERVKETLCGAPRLLILDEVHKLLTGTAASDDKVLTILRDLHDHTGTPMLLCGTTDVVAYLERRVAKGREPLAQIRRRIGIARDLTERLTSPDGGPGEPLFTVDEVRQVFARSKMRLAPDAARYLAALANLPESGSLGACRNLVVMATKVHERRADALSAEMLRNVQRLLVNRRAFAALEGRLEEQRARPVARVG